MKSIPDASVDMTLCDLPYGTTACKWGSVIPFDQLREQYERITKPKSAIVLTACQPFTSRLVMSNPDLFRYEWIWWKNNATGFLDAKKKPLNNYESILLYGKSLPNCYPQMREGKAHKRGSHPGKGASQIYRKFSRDRQKTKSNLYYPQRVLDSPVVLPKLHVHPTQKPVPLMEYLIHTYTLPGETVLDNCMGSGTTGVACVNTGRNFVGIELNAEYYQIAEKIINGGSHEDCQI